MSEEDIKNEGTYGTVEAKIRGIAEQFEDCGYMFANYAQANVSFDNIEKPTILYVLPASGELRLHNDQVKDSPSVMLWFLCPTDFDFDGEENECKIEAMKRLGVRFIEALNESGMFEYVESVPYQVAYDAFDMNLTGICFTPSLKEKQGIYICKDYKRAWSQLDS